MGSSLDEHRIIRHAYGAMRGYALMIPRAFVAWRALFAETGQDRIVPAAATYCLRMETDWYRHVATCLDHMGVAYRNVSAKEVARDLPMVNREGVLRVVETQGAGLLRAGDVVRDLVAHLPRHGVRLRAMEEIVSLDVDGGRLNGEGFDAVVVAAGAWLPGLLPGLAENPRASVQTVVYLQPPSRLAAAWGRAPMLLNRLPTRSGGVYILPPLAGLRLKAGDYDHTYEGDPSAPRVPKVEHVEAVLESCRMALADFDEYRVIEAKSCFYTVTENERFALRRIGARGWLVSACSGHGFKFAALMGLSAAEGITGERAEAEVSAFMAGRLTEDVLPSG